MRTALQPFQPVERPIRVANRIIAPKVAKGVSSCVPIPQQKVSTVLRAAAIRVKVMGFTSEFGEADGPACFMGSMSYVIGRHSYVHGDSKHKLWLEANAFVQNLIFNGDNVKFAEESLEREGWTARDAAAALDMSADYAEAIGR